SRASAGGGGDVKAFPFPTCHLAGGEVQVIQAVRPLGRDRAQKEEGGGVHGSLRREGETRAMDGLGRLEVWDTKSWASNEPARGESPTLCTACGWRCELAESDAIVPHGPQKQLVDAQGSHT